MAPAIRKDDVAYLRMLIEEHHLLFRELYPHNSIIPKMHFLIHVPDDILRYDFLDICMYMCVSFI